MEIKMSLQVTDHAASEKTIGYLTRLATTRNWTEVLQGQEWETAFDALGNVGNPDPKFISQREASRAIDALMKIRPTDSVNGSASKAVPNASFASLQRLLATLPLSKYALRRHSDGAWDFFEVIERKNGVRFLNRLLGAPGAWRREHLTYALQSSAARAIEGDPRAAAFEYARQHGRCSCCDALLSDPKSIAQSYGPICIKKFK